MLIDRKHTSWIVLALLLAVGVVLLYLWDAPRHPRGPSGSTPVGLGLGIAAMLIMLMLVSLGLKRAVPHWRLGSAQAWLRAHIWLGLLVPLLVALHGAFKAGGPLTTTLWVLMAVVVLTGVYGLILQQFLPSLLLHSTPGETVAQQLGRELDALVLLAEGRVNEKGRVEVRGAVRDFVGGELNRAVPDWQPTGDAKAMPDDEVKACVKAGDPVPGAEPLRRLYFDTVKPFLTGRERTALRSRARAEAVFESIRTCTPTHIHPGINELEGLAERRRQLEHQRLLMRLMTHWLYVHVPASWALVVLSIAHAVVALRY